jgi:hypothetical protein
LWQVGGFPGTPVSSTKKTDHYDITEILLKVVLNTISLTLTPSYRKINHVLLSKSNSFDASAAYFIDYFLIIWEF